MILIGRKIVIGSGYYSMLGYKLARLIIKRETLENFIILRV